MPKVSVAVPSLNVVDYIAECLESAIHQTLEDIEILCVDAGSTDGTLEIIREYAQKDSRIKLILSDKKSYGYQMNLALDAAAGEYLAILESDDIVRPTMYEDLYTLAKKHDLDLIKADHEIFVGDPENRTYTYRNICVDKFYNRVLNPAREQEVFHALMQTWSGIYKIAFLRENNIRHNETPGASYQDNGFWFQTFAWASRIYFVNKAYYLLRRDNPNSSVKNRGKVYCIFEEYAFIEKRLREDPEREARFIKMFHRKKFNNCQFHYSRIADEFKMEFLERLREEFLQARQAGELDPAYFLESTYRDLCQILEEPALYYVLHADESALSAEHRVILLEYKLKCANEELLDLQKSMSFRIGSAITFLPRKIRSAIQCCQENGFAYTVRHLFVRLGLREKP